MIKLFAISVVAVALSACSAMPGMSSMGAQPDSGATKNSTDANKANNPAAVSPGGAK